MKKKTVSLLLVAAMAVGMLAGCGGGKSSISQDGSSDAAEGNEKAEMADAKDVDGTTITFWHSMGGVNGQAIDTLVKKFNDENEYGITVEAQYQGEYDDSLNKLKSAQIGNMMYPRSNRTLLHIIRLIINYIRCLLTHLPQLCIIIKICSTKPVLQKSRTAWKQSMRLAIS